MEDFLTNSEEERLESFSGSFRNSLKKNEEDVDSKISSKVKATKNKSPNIETKSLISYSQKKDKSISVRVSKEVVNELKKILFVHDQVYDERIPLGQYINNILMHHIEKEKKETEELFRKFLNAKSSKTCR